MVQTTDKTRIRFTGTQLQEQIIDLARIMGWRVAHFRSARTKYGWRTAVSADGKGFPDLVLVRPPRIIVAECKSQYEKLSSEQKVWIEAFKSCPGAETFVWRPGDWDVLFEVLR